MNPESHFRLTAASGNMPSWVGVWICGCGRGCIWGWGEFGSQFSQFGKFYFSFLLRD